MTVRRLMWASLVTGLFLVVWFVNALGDPAYYDPQTFRDYLASVLAEIAFLGVAYTFVVWWQVTPVRRSGWLLPGAAVGFVLWSAGNVVEEIMRVEFGAYIFFVGASTAILFTGLAGVVTLTAPTRWRWTGLVLLGIVATLLLEDLPFLAPVPWLAFAYLLRLSVFDVEASDAPST